MLIMVSEIELKNFQINLMLELFMCLSFNLLNLFLNFYSLGVAPPLFFQICDIKILTKFLLFTFFLEFALFFSFFSQQEFPN
jgi:hypothetical protein